MVHWSVLVQAGRNFTGDFVSSDFLGLVVTDHFWSNKNVFSPKKTARPAPPSKRKGLKEGKKKLSKLSRC
jgi:hypothetical protein